MLEKSIRKFCSIKWSKNTLIVKCVHKKIVRGIFNLTKILNPSATYVEKNTVLDVY
jgi:hypothetical protein